MFVGIGRIQTFCTRFDFQKFKLYNGIFVVSLAFQPFELAVCLKAYFEKKINVFYLILDIFIVNICMNVFVLYLFEARLFSFQRDVKDFFEQYLICMKTFKNNPNSSYTSYTRMPWLTLL